MDSNVMLGRRVRNAFTACVCLWALATNGLEACSCFKYEMAPCERFDASQVAFLGRVVDADHADTRNSPIIRTFIFDVIEAFSGPVRGGMQAVVKSPRQGSMCGVTFERGETYLLYANVGSSGELQTGLCSGSIPIDHAEEHLDYIRARLAGKTVTTLQGSVQAAQFETSLNRSSANPLPEVEIAATHEGARFVTRTDAHGRYELRQIPAGDYVINARKSGYLSAQPSYPTTVRNRACSEVNIAMRTGGQVSGILRDRSGEPASRTTVQLWRVGPPPAAGTPDHEVTDEDGRFDFRGVEPGRYLLGVNMDKGYDPDAKEPRTYYPGVAMLRDAARLTLGKAEAAVQPRFPILSQASRAPRGGSGSLSGRTAR